MITAIDWFINELKENGLDHIDYAEDIIKQAKELEKLQIIEAYVQGCNDTYGIDEPSTEEDYDIKEGTDFYNKKFKVHYK